MSCKKYTTLTDRGIIKLNGEDRYSFLQGLVSCDVNRVSMDLAVYGAFLTPQGKFLFDFFAVNLDGCIYLDCELERTEQFCKRLNLYKLRSKVTIEVVKSHEVTAIFGDQVLASMGLSDTPGSLKHLSKGVVYTDPRLCSMGARCISVGNVNKVFLDLGFTQDTMENYEYERISMGLPDGSKDMQIEKSILLEGGFEELNGVDFDKGCYLGQEITARSKYRGLIKKRLIPVKISGQIPPSGTEIIQGDTKVGELRSTSGNKGIALIRINSLKNSESFTAGESQLFPIKPSWLNF